jgi:hypothetical protein
MINLVWLTALTTEKLHVLYLIGISVHRRGNMAAIMVLEKYCNCLVNRNVFILKEILFWLHNVDFFKQITCTKAVNAL